jgi:hypothetical protein
VLLLTLLLLLLLCADEMGVSSLHVTFPTGEEWAALGALGFQQRKGIQFHWCVWTAAANILASQRVTGYNAQLASLHGQCVKIVT